MGKYGDTGQKRTRAVLAAFFLTAILCGGCAEGSAKDRVPEEAGERSGTEADMSAAFGELLTETDGEAFWDPKADAEDGLQRAMTAAVRIDAGKWSGSGVVYEATESGLAIVTAAHVLADAGERVKVTFYDGWEAECAKYQTFEETDCAFLMVSGEDLPENYKENYAVAQKDRERFDRLESEQSIFLADPDNENGFGYRFALLSESWIYVEDFEQHMMLLSGTADAGMSGSGVYDESGCFLGILCGMSEEERVLAALPYSIVDAMYQQVDVRNK
ncbi:MAG: serine protease [Candidatus Gastranaerophilales bacterium]|nr:serine protease [Candidatus Gastranaerophilales bacterium]